MEDYAAIRLAPGNATVHCSRGACKAALGDLAGAVGDFDIVLLLDPDDADPYYNWGLTYTEMGEHLLAVEDCCRSTSATSSAFLPEKRQSSPWERVRRRRRSAAGSMRLRRRWGRAWRSAVPPPPSTSGRPGDGGVAGRERTRLHEQPGEGHDGNSEAPRLSTTSMGTTASPSFSATLNHS